MSNDEMKKSIYVLAVSANQESATNLLNKVFPNLQTTDSQEWTTKEGDFDVRCYIKYPDCDVNRRTPKFADFVITSVGEGEKEELDVVNYTTNRNDARERFLIDSKERKVQENVKVVEITAVNEAIKAYATELTEFNKTETEKDEYEKERRKFIQGENKRPVFRGYMKSYTKANKILDKFEKVINEFNVEPNLWNSTNTGKFDISPENEESNGVGFKIDLYSGEEFTKQNPYLPLVVRDTAVTLTLELFSKTEEGCDKIIQTLESAKAMAAQFGLMEQLNEIGATLTFSKDGKSVFVDVALGGIIGEGIISKIRSFNMDRFKFSLKDTLRFQTNINLKDVYNEPDFMGIISNLAKLSIIADGEILNVRGLLHLIRDFTKICKSEKDMKGTIMVSYGLLILSTFENFGFEVKYNSNDLKEAGIDFAESYMKMEEGQATEMINGFNETFKQGILPMVLSTIDSIKPMLEAFKPGLQELDLDKLCVEVIIPSVRTELKGTLILPGLTDFVTEKVLN